MSDRQGYYYSDYADVDEDADIGVLNMPYQVLTVALIALAPSKWDARSGFFAPVWHFSRGEISC